MPSLLKIALLPLIGSGNVRWRYNITLQNFTNLRVRCNTTQNTIKPKLTTNSE
jgi:hypothetical protein